MYQKGITDTHPPSVDPFSPSVQQKKAQKKKKYMTGIWRRYRQTFQVTVVNMISLMKLSISKASKNVHPITQQESYILGRR